MRKIQRAHLEVFVLSFLCLSFEFVSDFGFRISDFPSK